jgi:hypothetical protein
MRRGAEAGEEEMGGAWHCAARLRVEKSNSKHSPDVGATPNTTWGADTPWPGESCTKGPCVVGIVLQQS